MNLDEVLERLEQAIAKLADGTAPIDRLVAAYEEATKLAAQADKELEALEQRLAPR